MSAVEMPPVVVTDNAAEIARLQLAMARLREENEQLRRRVPDAEFPIPIGWGLTKSQGAMLRCLIAKAPACATRLELFEALTASGSAASRIEIVKVLMTGLRIKMLPLYVSVENCKGVGYAIDVPSLDRLKFLAGVK